MSAKLLMDFTNVLSDRPSLQIWNQVPAQHTITLIWAILKTNIPKTVIFPLVGIIRFEKLQHARVKVLMVLVFS